MICLGLNTAGTGCDIAICDGDELLSSKRLTGLKGQDSRLPQLLSDALSEAGLTLKNLQRLAVVTGPGSFTGVRVGVAFARGLALALDKPCLGVTSLEATLPLGQQGSALVALQAQRRPPDITYWTQTFRTGEATAEPREMRLEHLADVLNERPHMVYGDAAALSDKVPGLIIHPASASARIAAQFAISRDPDLHPPTPAYVRDPDADLPRSAVHQ